MCLCSICFYPILIGLAGLHICTGSFLPLLVGYPTDVMVVRVGKLYVAIPLQKYVARMSVQTHSQLIAVRVANSIQLSNLIIHAKSSQKEVA